jgi:hypothetical protein
MLDSNKISRDQARAFVNGSITISTKMSGPNGDYWIVRPQIVNAGNSAASSVTGVIGVAMFNPARLAKSNINVAPVDPDKSEITIGGQPLAFNSVAPHSVSQYGAFNISVDDAKKMRDAGDSVYVLGRLDYSSFDEHHMTKFCVRLYGSSVSTDNFAEWGDRVITLFESGNADLASRPCYKNNCTDADPECPTK